MNDDKVKEELPTRCQACERPISEDHVRFFSIHNRRGELLCARCYHRREADGRPAVTIPAWVADEIVCLLGLADGLPDLTRRTSKEIGCECQKQLKDDQGRVIDVIDLCIYHHARDVQGRASDVIDWLAEAGVPRRGS